MQSKKLLLSVIGGLAALSIVTPAFAVMSVPYGWFIEVNGGSAHLSNTNFGEGNFTTSGIGGNANLGYKFMPFLAAEVGYTQYPNVSIKTSNGTKAGQDSIYSYDISARGILPIADSGVEAFAKLGAQHIASHITIKNNDAADEIGLAGSHHSSTGLYMGVGAQYYFWPEFAVVAQWQRAQGSSNTGTQDLFSGGVSFIFD